MSSSSTVCGEEGIGVNAAAIHSGPHAGRLVVAFNYRLDPAGQYDVPRVIRSDDGGATWIPTVGPRGTSNRLDLDRDNLSILPVSPSDIPPGNLTVHNFATVVVDPNDPALVYVVFAGRSNPSSWLTDLYVALSRNGGETFAQQDVLHFRDSPPGTATPLVYLVHPAITIDRCGSANLMYYRISPPSLIGTTAVQIDVRYARILNLGNPDQTTWGTLCPAFSSDVLLGGNIGDYQMMTSSQDKVWACFASGHEGAMNFYIRYVKVPCILADFDANDTINAADIVAFGSDYSAGLPSADANGDGEVSPADWLTFVNSYTCGCNP